MGKYMFLFRGGMDRQNTSPADQQANMLKWKNWMDRLAATGKLAGGEPLDDGGTVIHGRAKRTTDGPFAEGREVVGGYVVVEAAGLEEAAALSNGCPIFDHDGSVEVRAVMKM